VERDVHEGGGCWLVFAGFFVCLFELLECLFACFFALVFYLFFLLFYSNSFYFCFVFLFILFFCFVFIAPPSPSKSSTHTDAPLADDVAAAIAYLQEHTAAADLNLVALLPQAQQADALRKFDRDRWEMQCLVKRA